MSRVVAVHDADPHRDWLRERWIERAAGRVEVVAKKPSTLATLPSKCLTIAASRDLSRRTPELEGDLRLLVDASIALFDAFRSDAADHVTLAGTTVGRPGRSAAGAVTPNTLSNALFAAILLRDRRAMTSLSAVPIELLRQSPTTALPLTYPMAEALQGMVTDRDRWQDVLRRALSLAEAERDDVAWVTQIAVPRMRMMEVVYSGDVAFDEAFAAALEGHRAYWGVDERKNDPTGLLALGPAALAAWARDAGFEVVTRSPYAPRWLIEGRGGEDD